MMILLHISLRLFKSQMQRKKRRMISVYVYLQQTNKLLIPYACFPVSVVHVLHHVK